MPIARENEVPFVRSLLLKLYQIKLVTLKAVTPFWVFVKTNLKIILLLLKISILISCPNVSDFGRTHHISDLTVIII